MTVIPLSALPNQEFWIILDGQHCVINLYQRSGRMYMDLSTPESIVQKGALVMPRTPIITAYSNGFKGQLYIRDTARPPQFQEAPVYDGLGSRFELCYLTDYEVKEIAKYKLQKAFSVDTGNTK